ncbi:MAG: hypothetical protein IJS01_00025 [Lentisphaeria bacterium]|nr:hypothetical protein [Lentisphaeria bacterium]
MKIVSVCAAIFCLFLGLTAAENSQIVIFNTGKNATIKAVEKGGLNIFEKTATDRKTGARLYQCLYFAISAKSQSALRTITVKFEAANGDLSVLVGLKNSAMLRWTSLKVDGKELLTNVKTGEIFNTKNFSAGKIGEKKLITLEGTFRGTTRKEQTAAKNASQNKKAAKKNKSSKNK